MSKTRTTPAAPPPTDMSEDDLQILPAKQAERPAPNAEMAEYFKEGLQRLDENQGTGLVGLFEQCMRFHDENEVLRVQFREMHALGQDQLRKDLEMRDVVATEMKRLQSEAEKGENAEARQMRLDCITQLAKLQDQITRTTLNIQKTALTIASEIRESEFQDQYIMHVSVFNQFMTMLSAIIFKHCQGFPPSKLESFRDDVMRAAKVINQIGLSEIERG